MKILMISTTFPYPPTRGATQVRTFNLLKYLSKRHAITLVTQRSEEIKDIEVEKLQQWVEELVMFPQPQPSEQEKGIKEKLQRWSTILQQGTPQKVLQLYSTPMQQWLDQAVEGGQFDLITCEHSTNEIYVRPEWREQLRTVVNIHHSVYRKSLDKLETKTSDNQLKDQLNLPLLRRYEEQYCAKFTDIVVTTAEDRRQIESFELDSKITLISNGVDVNTFPRRISDPGGHRLVFSGLSIAPVNTNLCPPG
ncbi:MAG: glycosyltransferase, partial [Moorea sp. SIO3E2]|nr:glycosyltransferase [Moorena sp. SIO3E2]